MKKINVYVRHAFYSPNSVIGNRIRPVWFDKKKIWNNFIETVNKEMCNVKIIYDTYFGDNSDIFFTEDIEVIKINCGTEASSFLEILKIIENDNLSDDSIIYILEDDYLHRENWCNAIIEGVEISDYISLYDHLDKYLDYPDLNSKIVLTKSVHWRTVPSTCNTYACKMITLKTDMGIHKLHSINCHNNVTDDNGKFLRLGRIGRTLFTPIPAFSTHCDGLLSPIINWEKYIK